MSKQTPSREEREEELLDELCETISKLVRYYSGMLAEITESRYSIENSVKDYDTLATGEYDLLAVLGDYMNLDDDYKYTEDD
jgi:hypothetical protein